MTFIVKRDGTREIVQLDKILNRIQKQCFDLPGVNALRVAKRVVQGLHDGVDTGTLDELAAQTAATLTSFHPDYSFLASRIAVTRLHKRTLPSIRASFPLLTTELIAFANENLDALDSALKFERDLDYDYFGLCTLMRSYLGRDPNDREVIIERPQVMLMRVSLAIHVGNLPKIRETYESMSMGLFTHATPTMFNAGCSVPSMASCFLMPILEDSVEGIFETVKRSALISKSAGGIGFSTSNVRATGSRIRGTGGHSNGLVPMLRTFESTARYIDQGGGKRKGAFAAYLEPWHADVRAFLDMKKNHGVEELRARDLFYALWIPDIFMRRVESGDKWSLFCPTDCPDLINLYGREFDDKYESYERLGLARETIDAQEIWFAILEAQVETGTPYMLYKDACNAKSNQKHLGTIRSSNLCTEIVQYSSATEIAVCNLASVCLPKFVVRENGKSELQTSQEPVFDFEGLACVVRQVTYNLNRVIDLNAYACEEAKRSNLKHRPIGIGVQGLADTFVLMNMPFDSQAAAKLNRQIFECMYFAALQESCFLAQVHGRYESFYGSPVSSGLLQPDFWDNPELVHKIEASSKWDWKQLRADIAMFGIRNSLLLAPMPTASTAQIMGNNECFEPFTSNIYVRRVLAGEFVVINKHLVKELENIGMWNEHTRLAIIEDKGSVQNIDGIPPKIKELFKTSWEMSMRVLIDMAAERGKYICQSQSLNLFMAEPTHKKLSAMHFYAWKKGLKTGMYYLRTKAATEAFHVTGMKSEEEQCLSCSA